MPSGIDLCFLWLADAFMPATGDAVRTALAGEAGLDPITKNGRAPVLGENLWQGTLHANSVYCDVTAYACSTEAVAQASTVTLCMRHAGAQLARCILQFDVGSCCDDSRKLGGWEALGTQGVVRRNTSPPQHYGRTAAVRGGTGCLPGCPKWTSHYAAVILWRVPYQAPA
jgi:hypothetical protein